MVDQKRSKPARADGQAYWSSSAGTFERVSKAQIRPQAVSTAGSDWLKLIPWDAFTKKEKKLYWQHLELIEPISDTVLQIHSRTILCN